MTSPAYQVTDPSIGEVVETFEHATDEQIESALSASAAAYKTWKDVPIAERAETVKKIAALFAERADELACQRAVPCVGTIDLLFALFEIYGGLMDRALYLRGTSRDELAAHLSAIGDHAEARV